MYWYSETSAVWLQGDMHLQNLSAFRDSKDNSIFDTYDFDEGYLGPYAWDLRRMIRWKTLVKQMQRSLSI